MPEPLESVEVAFEDILDARLLELLPDDDGCASQFTCAALSQGCVDRAPPASGATCLPCLGENVVGTGENCRVCHDLAACQAANREPCPLELTRRKRQATELDCGNCVEGHYTLQQVGAFANPPILEDLYTCIPVGVSGPDPATTVGFWRAVELSLVMPFLSSDVMLCGGRIPDVHGRSCHH